MNPRTRAALLRSVVPLVLMATIFYFSAQPGIDHNGWFMVLLRKLGHVTEYALLTAAWWWTLRVMLRQPLRWAIGISLGYACTDEFHQTFVHGRDGTARDVAIDALGMAIAAAVIVWWRGRAKREARPRSSLAPSP